VAGLTFPGAQEAVLAVQAEIRQKCRAVPPKINYADEPAGDFGIAHFYGLDISTALDSDFRETFDAGRIPQRYVIIHELGHALSANVSLYRGGDGFTNGLYNEFWRVRGFPGTPWEAQLKAIELTNTQGDAAGYKWWPEENFADAFGAVYSYGQGTLITRTDAYLNEPALRAFYSQLRGKYMATLDSEDVQNVAKAVANFLLPEILGKLDAGFNTTLTTVADRLAAGDKHTATAAID